MRFGLRYASLGRFSNGPDAVEVAQAAEAAGLSPSTSRPKTCCVSSSSFI